MQSLQRNHIVALINALGRVSHSVDAARVVVPLLQHAKDAAIRRAAVELADAEDLDALDQLECHQPHGGDFGL